MHLGAVQQLTGDYPAAAATLRQALALCRDLGDRLQQAQVLTELAAVQRLTGDYPVRRCQQPAGPQPVPRSSASVNSGLRAQRARPGAAADRRLPGRRRQPPAGPRAVPRRLGDRPGQAETLNCLGELASRTADGHQARDHHTQALAIARDLGTPSEEARALEGIGHSHLRDGNPTQAAAPLRDALAIYQRIAAPAARRVQETLLQLRQDNLAPAPER